MTFDEFFHEQENLNVFCHSVLMAVCMIFNYQFDEIDPDESYFEDNHDGTILMHIHFYTGYNDDKIVSKKLIEEIIYNKGYNDEYKMPAYYMGLCS